MTSNLLFWGQLLAAGTTCLLVVLKAFDDRRRETAALEAESRADAIAEENRKLLSDVHRVVAGDPTDPPSNVTLRDVFDEVIASRDRIQSIKIAIQVYMAVEWSDKMTHVWSRDPAAPSKGSMSVRLASETGDREVWLHPQEIRLVKHSEAVGIFNLEAYVPDGVWPMGMSINELKALTRIRAAKLPPVQNRIFFQSPEVGIIEVVISIFVNGERRYLQGTDSIAGPAVLGAEIEYFEIELDKELWLPPTARR